MTVIKTVSGELDASDLRVVIVAARFNDSIVQQLIEGAEDTLRHHGASEKDLVLVRVPGAFELPLAVRTIARSRRYDAVIALAVVIRGETPHFEYVAGECSSGLASIALSEDVPVAFGVLTCDTAKQAQDRAGGKAGNKGVEAASAAIEMVNLLRKLDNSS